jgi:hypothetical protein
MEDQSDPGCFKKFWMTITCRHGKMEKERLNAKKVLAAHKVAKKSAKKLLLAQLSARKFHED